MKDEDPEFYTRQFEAAAAAGSKAYAESYGVSDAMKPEGISDREWELIRDDRVKQAQEAERAALWPSVLDQLANAVEEGDPDDWAPSARLFVERARAADWGHDIEDFAEALMRELGFGQRQIRGHGICWKRA
jgi:hypothetical protein